AVGRKEWAYHTFGSGDRRGPKLVVVAEPEASAALGGTDVHQLGPVGRDRDVARRGRRAERLTRPEQQTEPVDHWSRLRPEPAPERGRRGDRGYAQRHRCHPARRPRSTWYRSSGCGNRWSSRRCRVGRCRECLREFGRRAEPVGRQLLQRGEYGGLDMRRDGVPLWKEGP